MVQGASGLAAHTFIAGGCLRDLLLGIPVADIDLFTVDWSETDLRLHFPGVEMSSYGTLKHFHQHIYGVECDLIFVRDGYMKETIEAFDYGICQIAHDGKNWFVPETFIRDFENRELVLRGSMHDNCNHAEKIAKKLAPYGFRVREEKGVLDEIF